MFLLTEELIFPPVEMADEDGLLAIGGDLSTERLLLAYRKGIFPWYSEDEPICWWTPDPRFILFPDDLKVSKSAKKLLNAPDLQFRFNTDFKGVIENCKTIYRKGQPGTWISPQVQNAYTRLHESGYAHSAETWQDGILVGGLYGIRLGNIFFGESMFSKIPGASKYAFINYVRMAVKENIQLIDCQVYTRYLESFGARMIKRDEFMAILKTNIG